MSQMTFVPYGAQVSAGRFECVDCGRQFTLEANGSLPPCPNHEDGRHEKDGWIIKSGCSAIPATECANNQPG